MAPLCGFPLPRCLRLSPLVVIRHGVAGGATRAAPQLQALALPLRPQLSSRPGCVPPLFRHAFSSTAPAHVMYSSVGFAAKKTPASVVRPASGKGDAKAKPKSAKSTPIRRAAAPPTTVVGSAVHVDKSSSILPSAHPQSASTSVRSSTTEQAISQSPVGDDELTDDPVVIYRGGPAFNPKFVDLLGFFAFASGVLFAVLIYKKMPWPLKIFGFIQEDAERRNEAGELLRTVLSILSLMLGAAAAFYFFGMQMRTVTRITLHLKSGLVAIRTVKPTAYYYLPRRFLNPDTSGLDSPWATVDGRLGSKPDKRTRVFALENVYTQLQRSTMQYYARNELLPTEALMLRSVLPKRQTRPERLHAKNTKFTTKESADTDDLTYLVIKPYVMLWSIRASGGREAANEGHWIKQAWRKWMLPPSDFDDLTPAQAKAVRVEGDAYLNHLAQVYAKQHKVHPEMARAAIMPEGLSERQVWFKDRQIFDELFPVV